MKTISVSAQFYWLLLLSAIAFCIGMQVAPLHLEEPRRALVAMEMLYSGEWVHTTIHGAPYYNKPPLFNWVLAGGYRLFGIHEWVSRAVTVISHLLIALQLFLLTRRHIHERAALVAAGFYLVGGDILFYFSYVGEIDIFFSLLVVTGWFSFFGAWQKKRYALAYNALYFFMFLAFITKGLPGIVFLAFSLGIWLWYTHRFGEVFKWPHLSAILLFASLCGLYLLPFVLRGDAEVLVKTFWSESVDRTAGNYSMGKRLSTFFTFPFTLAKDIAPGVLLLLTFSRSKFKKVFVTYPLVSFAVFMIVANLWVYWISPESRSRYLYMFHPLFWVIIAAVFSEGKPDDWKKRWLNTVFIGMASVVVIALIMGFFLLPAYFSYTGIRWVPLAGLAVALLCIWLHRNRVHNVLWLAMGMLLVLRGVSGYIITADRSVNSKAAVDRTDAELIIKQVGNHPLYLLDSVRFSTTTSFYLEQKLGRIIPFTSKVKSGDYIIVPGQPLDSRFDYYHKIYYHTDSFRLARKL